MKEYIKPTNEVIDIQSNNHFLTLSAHDEMGDGVWLSRESEDYFNWWWGLG